MNLIQNTSIFIIVLGMGLSHPANAQIQPLSPDAHHAEAYRLQEGEEMFLDGRMDEPFWDNVTPITNFTQQQPVEGAPPSERTEIYVAYDDENLYIGAFFYDSNPEDRKSTRLNSSHVAISY